MSIKKTPEQILEYINKHKKDFFDFSVEDLSGYLPWELAKQFYKEEFVKKVDSGEEEWVLNPQDGEGEIREYMAFAWDKANWCRGLSAGRSINHMANWLFVDGKDELSEEIRDYSYYGKPQLVRICEEYGIDWKQYDDGKWVESEDDEPKTAEQVLGRIK